MSVLTMMVFLWQSDSDFMWVGSNAPFDQVRRAWIPPGCAACGLIVSEVGKCRVLSNGVTMSPHNMHWAPHNCFSGPQPPGAPTPSAVFVYGAHVQPQKTTQVSLVPIVIHNRQGNNL